MKQCMKWILMFFLAFAVEVHSQLNLTFSNIDELTSSGRCGTPEKFQLTPDGMLQLNALGETSDACVMFPSSAIEDGQWQCDVKMGFDPSSQNFCRFYIAADAPDPALVQNGWFVAIGQANDNVSLCRIDNGQSQCIINGESHRLARNNVDVSVRVTYSNQSGWNLETFIDGQWFHEGSALSHPIESPRWCGIYCKYTNTRSNKFWFDNLVVSGSPLKDRVPPQLTDFRVRNQQLIECHFSEPVLLTSATALMIDAEQVMLQFDPSVPNKATCHVATPLADGFSGQMRLSGITDLEGNVMKDTLVLINYVATKVIKAFFRNMSLVVVFSTPMDETNVAGICIDAVPLLSTHGTPKWENNTTLVVPFTVAPINRTRYQVRLGRLYDAHGDPFDMPELVVPCFVPERYDLVITELMTDPDPPVNLPDRSYIELYNRSDFDLEGEDYAIVINEKRYVLPSVHIPSHDFVVLVKDDTTQWPCPVLKVKGLPTLPKTAGEIVLLDAGNLVLDAICYDEQWQDGTFKTQGGWSLEIIDCDNRSGMPDNWHYSVSTNGGTPGLLNSVDAIYRDVVAPAIDKLLLPNDTTLVVCFTEPMMDLTRLQMDDLTFEPTCFVSSLIPDSIYGKSLIIRFATPPTIGQLFELSFDGTLTDYAGNGLTHGFVSRFMNAKPPLLGDIKFNELMFNPSAEDVDFVEVVNVSNHAVLMNQLYLSAMKDDVPEKLVSLSTDPIPMLPGEPWVFSANRHATLSNHHCAYPWRVMSVSLPSMPDQGGDVAITDRSGSEIDRVTYLETWHHPTLASKVGVSLERVSVSEATQSSCNWSSASSLRGYSTPTDHNSQSTCEIAADSYVSLTPQLFTPDMDGTDDYLYIDLAENAAGGNVTLRIYSKEGLPVKQLANHVLVGNGERFRWDGTGDQGQRMVPGVYVVWVRIDYADGRSEEHRMTCYLGLSAR